MVDETQHIIISVVMKDTYTYSLWKIIHKHRKLKKNRKLAR